MLRIEKDGYTKQEILDQLHFRYGSNEIKFRYELLDKFERRKFTLKNVIDAEISMAAFAGIKRTARFKIKEGEDVDWLNDRIQPYFLLKMPKVTRQETIYTTVKAGEFKVGTTKVGQITSEATKTILVTPEKWVEWSLGIFILSSPNRIEESGAIFRDIEAYDGLIILKDDKFLNRYTIEEGTNYITAINDILSSSGITKINIEHNEANLKRAKEFEPGTEKLKAANDLLTEINWTTLWVDEQGYYTSSRYRSPADRPSEYDYFDNEVSILTPDMEEELDLVNVANSWVVVASNPEEEPLTANYTNENPDSPTSTINRGRAIADYREIESIANQDSLDKYVERLAFNASQVFGYITFETALNPLHSFSDVYNVRYSKLGIDDKYGETNWTMPLKAGGKMNHEARKVVNI